MSKPARAFPALALAALLLAGCGSPQQSVAPAPPSSPPAVTSVSPSPQPSSPPAASSPAPAPSASAPAPSVQPAAPARPGLPKELIIPAINVDAPVEHVGQDPDGAMSVPKEWMDVGWFDLGYRPGEKGSAVIAGHLDSTTDRAVFWDLHKLKAGDKVLLKDESGAKLTFQVMSSQPYPFDRAPLEKIFGPAGVPMLNLITCNGTFDRASKNYNQRLVVYTKEVPS